MSFSFLCVWVKANVPFTEEYVFRLRSMVHRSCSRAHEFFVLTDRPEALRGLSHVPIRVPTPSVGTPGWWSKLELFNPKHGLRGPGVYLDLDVLLTDNLERVLDFDAPMALIPHEGEWNGRKGLRVVKRYNSSVIRMRDLSAYSALWERFTPEVPRRLWGDQDWIGEQLPGETVMPLEWFPRVSQLDLSAGRKAIPQEAAVVLCKKPKNHEIAPRCRWFDQAWGA